MYLNLCLSMRKYVCNHVVMQSAGPHVLHSLILSDKGLVSLTLACTQYSTAHPTPCKRRDVDVHAAHIRDDITS